MSELKFTRVNNEKYNTVSIIIENAFIKIKEEDFEIIERKSRFDYVSGTIILFNQDLKDKLKSWETQINDYLKNNGGGKITILYGNKIYPKIRLPLSTEGKDQYRISVKSIWVNERNKPFIQLLYVHFKN